MVNYTSIIQIIAAFLTGGVVFKAVIDRFSMTKKERYTTLLMLVEQLQNNVNQNNAKVAQLETKCEHLEAQVDEWREAYYAAKEENSKLSNELRRLTIELKKYNLQK